MYISCKSSLGSALINATGCDVDERHAHYDFWDVFSGDKPGRWVLRLKHSAAAAAAGLRPYLKTFLRVLRSHSDFQTSRPGSALLLKYTMKYVMKFAEKSSFTFDENDHGPEVAARRLLDSWQPMEPQMWMILDRVATVRISWKTKKCRPPLPLQENPHKEYGMYLAYMGKKPEEPLSFLMFLRRFRTSGKQAQVYKIKQSVAVGIRYVSPSNDHFFGQWLCMNVPHSRPQDLVSQNAKVVPEALLYYASAREKAPQIWKDDGAARRELERRGDSKEYIDACIHKMAADALAVDTCIAEQRAIPRERLLEITGDLNQQQQMPYHLAWTRLRTRADLEERGATEAEWDTTFTKETALAILGFPGSGKTYTVLRLVKAALALELSVAVATPAAKLLGLYRRHFGDALSLDTVHAHFGIDAGDNTMKIQTSLSKFHLIIVDELSMLPEAIVDHILATWKALSRWFLLVFVGDFCQLEPVGGASSVGNALSSRTWRWDTKRFTLHPDPNCGRCKDATLSTFLTRMRTHTISQKELDRLLWIRTAGAASQESVAKWFQRNPLGAVLCFSNKDCERVHGWALEQQFGNRRPIAEIPIAQEATGEPRSMLVYSGMRVMLTYNYHKGLAATNGVEVTVEAVARVGLLVRLQSGLRYYVWPRPAASGGPAVYHIGSAYAITVHKAQGLTYESLGLWLQGRRIPSGLVYTALSRVSSLSQLTVFGSIRAESCTVQTLPDWL